MRYNSDMKNTEERTETPVGQSVYDLAESFMQDEDVSEGQAARATQQLAEAIQQAIEDFTEELQNAGGWLCDYCGKDCRDAGGTAGRRCRDAHNHE